MGTNLSQPQPPTSTSDIPSPSNSMQSPHNITPAKQTQQYIGITSPKLSITGKPCIVKSNQTNLQLQQYHVSNSQSTLQYDIQIYKLRSSSYSKNIAVVFHHKVVDENQKLFMVRVEKMKGRLNQIQGVNIMEGLCLIEAAFNGLAQLVYHAKTPFVVTDKMIAINQSSQVRVWLNQNYALNKIMPGIKIRNQNIMIHQVFSAVADRIIPEEKQAFGDFRFKIAQCARLIDAKNIITNILINCNRKAVLTELVDKQMQRVIKSNLIQGSQVQGVLIQGPGQPLVLGPLINQSTINFKNTHQNQFPNQNIKIPMNISLPGQPSIPLQNPTIERVQIVAQQYIKDDEGADRIRMVRQQYKNNLATQSYPGYSAPRQNKQMELQRVIEYPPVNTVGGGNSSNVVAASVGLQNGKGRDGLGNMHRTMDQRVNTEVAPNRTRKIFAVSPPPKSEQNIDICNKLSPRDHSPIKAKPSTITNLANMDQKGPSTTTLTNKIALSQNKINQMQKKINRLKQQFNRNNTFQRKNVHINNANTLDYRTLNEKQMLNDRYRGSVTPPHHNGHRSPLHQDARPGTRYQKNIRFKSETVVGETAAKWDRKLSQLIGQNGKVKGEEDASFDRKDNNSKTQRNSEIVEDLRQLKRSMITEPTSKRNQLVIITPTYPPQPHQSDSEPREKSPTFTSRTPTSTQQKPPSIPIMFRPVHNHKPIQAVFANGNHAYHQGAPKTNGVQININGNHYMGNGMNSGVNNAVNNGIPNNGAVREGYGAVLENKSTIMVRKNHF